MCPNRCPIWACPLITYEYQTDFRSSMFTLMAHCVGAKLSPHMSVTFKDIPQPPQKSQPKFLSPETTFGNHPHPTWSAQKMQSARGRGVRMIIWWNLNI